MFRVSKYGNSAALFVLITTLSLALSPNSFVAASKAADCSAFSFKRCDGVSAEGTLSLPERSRPVVAEKDVKVRCDDALRIFRAAFAALPQITAQSRSGFNDIANVAEAVALWRADASPKIIQKRE